MANEGEAERGASGDAEPRCLAAPGVPARPLPGKALRSNVPKGGVDPKTHQCDRSSDNEDVRAAMREIAVMRRRFGYRRIGVLLEREGMTMNHSKPDRGTVRGTVSPAKRSADSTARKAW